MDNKPCGTVITCRWVMLRNVLAVVSINHNSIQYPPLQTHYNISMNDNVSCFMQTQLHSVYKGSQEYSLNIQGLKITWFGDINLFV